MKKWLVPWAACGALCGAMVLSETALAKVELGEAQNLSAIQAWQCRRSAKHGRDFAHEALARVNQDCSGLLTRKTEILELYLGASDFATNDPAKICFLDAYRAEIVSLMEGLVQRCAAGLGDAFSAGLQLGYHTCRFGVLSQDSPPVEMVHLRSTQDDPNTHEPFPEVVYPIWSPSWLASLWSQQDVGFHAGCIVGTRDLIRGKPHPAWDGASGVAWNTVGIEIGKAFGKAYCPWRPDMAEELARTVVGGAEGETKTLLGSGISLGVMQTCLVQGR